MQRWLCLQPCSIRFIPVALQTDGFLVDASIQYGSLQAITIGYAKKGGLGAMVGDAWFLDSLEVQDITSGQKSVFRHKG